MTMPRQRNDILQGTLVLLVLKTLASQGRMHGYAITAHIQRVSADLLRVEEGSLYPALHRMEQDGWVRADWGTTEKNRQARHRGSRQWDGFGGSGTCYTPIACRPTSTARWRFTWPNWRMSSWLAA
jgi:hypothetical protein